MNEEMVYLGFVTYIEGFKMDPEKARAIIEWHIPEIIGEVYIFMKWLVSIKSSLRISF